MLSTISVIGLGKLGAPIVACFAARGFQVIAVDIDAQKADAIGRGAPPVHEPRLAELLKESKGRLQKLRESRSEEHTSELQSRSDLVCRLLLEKKKKRIHYDRSVIIEK